MFFLSISPFWGSQKQWRGELNGMGATSSHPVRWPPSRHQWCSSVLCGRVPDWFLRLRPLRSSVQNQLVRSVPFRPVPSVPSRIFGDFYQKDMRVAHLCMLTGVLKLDFWGSRKVAFTFGAFRSDICVRRVPCFDHLFRYFLREKILFFACSEHVSRWKTAEMVL